MNLNFLKSFLLNFALGALSTNIRSWPQDRLDSFLVRFGLAFGPPGLRHFSQLSPSEQSALLARVPVLKGTHTDWLKPFQWVPRSLTVWVGPAPQPSDILWGFVSPGDRSPVPPVPKPGEAYVLRGYLASTDTFGIHDRLGWRYDDVDSYWELSAAFKLPF